eukprot:TRINITY_DN11288_c0_g1_i1.p1 TRINITY_DN11288_c0_g1~~TRINITY_DN11288_c0_g1_i1.p1  ORF type:complete len:717 (+),score=70.00 TRINITY_DN11288_c0_g1_i1:35-2152(+)
MEKDRERRMSAEPPEAAEGDGGGTMPTGGRMPDYSDLAKLPGVLQEELRSFAGKRLGALLAPMMRMRRAGRVQRSQSGSSAAATAAAEPVEVATSNALSTKAHVFVWKHKSLRIPELVRALRSHPQLADWPDVSLRRLVECAKQHKYGAGEWVINEGDQCNDLWVLVNGNVQLVTKNTEGRGTQEMLLVPPFLSGSRNAPHVIALAEAVTEAQHFVSVQATSPSALLAIPRKALVAEMQQLSSESRRSMYDSATDTRERAVQCLCPMTEDALSQMYMFSPFSRQQLTAITHKLRARCVRPSELICLSNDAASEMYVLRAGTLEVLLPGLRELPVLVQGPALICEMAYIFSERRCASVRAMTTVDLWVLQHSDLQTIVGDSRSMKEKILALGCRQRLKWMQSLKARAEADMATGKSNHLLRYLQQAPILKDVCSTNCLEEVARALEPCVYTRGEVMVSPSDLCDRLLIVVRGCATVSHGGDRLGTMGRGDAVGFTCVTEHHWLFPIKARDSCDVWYILRSGLTNILRKHGSLVSMQNRVSRLMSNTLRRVVGPLTPPQASHPTADPGILRSPMMASTEFLGSGLDTASEKADEVTSIRRRKSKPVPSVLSDWHSPAVIPDKSPPGPAGDDARLVEEALRALAMCDVSKQQSLQLRRAAAAARARPTAPASKGQRNLPGRAAAWEYRPEPVRRFRGLTYSKLSFVET